MQCKVELKKHFEGNRLSFTESILGTLSSSASLCGSIGLLYRQDQTVLYCTVLYMISGQLSHYFVMANIFPASGPIVNVGSKEWTCVSVT